MPSPSEIVFLAGCGAAALGALLLAWLFYRAGRERARPEPASAAALAALQEQIAGLTGLPDRLTADLAALRTDAEAAQDSLRGELVARIGDSVGTTVEAAMAETGARLMAEVRTEIETRGLRIEEVLGQSLADRAGPEIAAGLAAAREEIEAGLAGRIAEQLADSLAALRPGLIEATTAAVSQELAGVLAEVQVERAGAEATFRAELARDLAAEVGATATATATAAASAAAESAALLRLSAEIPARLAPAIDAALARAETILAADLRETARAELGTLLAEMAVTAPGAAAPPPSGAALRRTAAEGGTGDPVLASDGLRRTGGLISVHPGRRR